MEFIANMGAKLLGKNLIMRVEFEPVISSALA